MRCKTIVFVLAALSAILVPVVAFAEDFPTDAEKKAWQDAVGAPAAVQTPLNCSAAIPIACGASGVAGTTVGATNQTSTYNCTGFTEGGGEAIYVFTLAQNAVILGRINAGSPDLDLFLLSACDNSACLAVGGGGTATADSVKACLGPGTYYLLVDGFGSTNVGRAFTISLTCTEGCTPCNATCTLANDLCAGATVLAAPGVYSIQQDMSSASCATNSYTLASGVTSCTRFSAAGRDVVYKIVLATGCVICVSYDRCDAFTADFDRSIYLLNSCPSGTPPIDVTSLCVAGEDSTVSGTGPEDFCYTVGTARSYYLVADAFGTNVGGKFQLDVTITCPPVGTESSTWGNVKRLFR